MAKTKKSEAKLQPEPDAKLQLAPEAKLQSATEERQRFGAPRLRAHGDALVLIGMGLVALIVLFLPVQIPYSIRVQGKVVPVRSWVLMRGSEGELVNTFYDYRQGTVQNFSVAQFEERDAIRFALNDSLVARGRVRAGDMIGALYSGYASRQLARLGGTLAAERALLRTLLTGERVSEIEEAERVLERARIQEDQQRAVVERTRQLATRGAVAQQELELALSTLRVFEQNVEIAGAQLRSARTGAKQEQVDLVRTRISSLEAEITALREQGRNQTVYSPITGPILRTPNTDTLLVVTDTTSHVVYIPVPVKHYQYVSVGQGVDVATLLRERRLQAMIVRRDPVVHTVNGQQVMTLVAVVDSESVANFFPGMQTECRIRAGTVTPFEYVRRFAGYLFR